MPTPTDTMTIGNISRLLKDHSIASSAPCRIDLGGTLDIGCIHYPLRHLDPSTVNIALNRRTTIRLQPMEGDRIRISSAGVAEAQFDPCSAPYDHALGLMFAVADYFSARGVHVRIDSTSPPRSGLGGSSVAAVALIAAFSKVLGCMGKPELSLDQMVLLAHAIEQAVAGAPCGIQDHLAAAFGGVNTWRWTADPTQLPFSASPLMGGSALGRLNPHLLVAYLGVTHISADVNNTWIKQFISGQNRRNWHAIIRLTNDFAAAISGWDMKAAVEAMNQETAIRKAMTPQVLDDMGDRLAALAIGTGCGARFTGAGGGGCLWAIGDEDAVAALKPIWKKVLGERPKAGLLDCRVDPEGVL